MLIGGSVGGPGQQAEIGSTSNGPESPERPSNTPTSPAPTERSGQQPPAHDDPATGVGAAVRDGKFEFVVKNVKCGAQNIGGQFGSDAQGEFCQIRITVKNIGDEPQDMFSDNQYALNAAGQEFSPDGSAMIFSANSDMWMSEINPGNSVSGELIYDVPRGTKLTKLEVHDSAFSSGATIDLR
ncbi:DUF4352 domain-containing protein [Microbacterium sp.]|uniref:DUF4352 domain-containing protein n=1 Tax=Microbacterium sp. TaxID=51671 RepID=UPI002734F041|nr:DUF4352 domain-containing protein [Microbacterium sp.]MDP3950527.1 DUF4352 domain-containing protein [Microbacterium sp.]